LHERRKECEIRNVPTIPTILLSVRYSPEVVDYIKSTGEGWQTRMEGALKE
jgi:uncharacterized protein (DUF4415 family)